MKKRSGKPLLRSIAFSTLLLLRETVRLFRDLFGNHFVLKWQTYIRSNFGMHVTFNANEMEAPRVILVRAGLGMAITCDVSPIHLFPDELFESEITEQNEDRINCAVELVREIYRCFGICSRIIRSNKIHEETWVYAVMEDYWQTLYAVVFGPRWVTPTMTYRRDAIPFWIQRFLKIRLGLGEGTMEGVEELHRDVRNYYMSNGNRALGVNQLPIAPTQWKVVEHKAKVYDSMSASLHISRFSRTPLEKVQSEVEPVYKQFDIFVNKPTASCTYSRRICFACGREIRLARSKTPADMRSMLKSLMERASPSSCLTQDEIDIACPVYEVLIQDGSNKRWEPHEICKCIFTHSKYRACPRVYYDGKSQKALSKQKKENERRILPSK